MSEDKEIIVLKALKESPKPLKTKELSEIVGFETKEVSKIIKKLKKEGKVISPKRCYYSVKN